MKVTFEYSKEKDIWCLLHKGKASNNSQASTKQYAQLVAEYGDDPTPKDAAAFIAKYLADNKIDVHERIQTLQKEWGAISEEYEKRAAGIFGTSLPSNVVGYLTVNGRCPYSIEHSYFYVSLGSDSIRETAMHELWHFYTWYTLGTDQEEKLGKQKYNDLKESLTVLLNAECADLFSKGTTDQGYPQHKEMRENILKYWAKDRNISNLWKFLTA